MERPPAELEGLWCCWKCPSARDRGSCKKNWASPIASLLLLSNNSVSSSCCCCWVVADEHLGKGEESPSTSAGEQCRSSMALDESCAGSKSNNDECKCRRLLMLRRFPSSSSSSTAATAAAIGEWEWEGRCWLVRSLLELRTCPCPVHVNYLFSVFSTFLFNIFIVLFFLIFWIKNTKILFFLVS